MGWSCKKTTDLSPVSQRCSDCPGACEWLQPIVGVITGGGRLTSFPEEWAAARSSVPVSEQWLEGLLAHKDEGPIGEPAARDLLREVMRLRGASMSEAPLKQIGNATIHSFRTSGKWCSKGRATVSEVVFRGLNNPSRRQRILAENGGRCPGLNSRGETMVWVVLLDDDVGYGFPLMLRPEGD